MKRVLVAALLTSSFMGSAAFVSTASANEVAGKPALPTTTVEDVIATRDKWGTEPSK